MSKKVTFFVISNDGGFTRQLVVSAVWVRAAITAAVVLGIALAVGMVDYFGLIAQSIENKRLKVEITQLRNQFEIVEGKLDVLENSLERVKTFSKKLRLITNIDQEDRPLRLAIGPVPQSGESVEQWGEAVADRMPASKLENRDDVFFEKPPLDEAKGELMKQKSGQRDYATLAVRIDRAVKESKLREQSVLDLWELLAERQSLITATPNILPVRGWPTSRFGFRESPFTGRPMMHTGFDLAAAPGTPIYAPADGVVSFAGYDEGYGKLISIDHGYGVVTRFGHNSQIYVTVGQKVSRWDVIGTVGNTGRSTGPHLHYEVRVNGMPVNPANYILNE